MKNWVIDLDIFKDFILVCYLCLFWFATCYLLLVFQESKFLKFLGFMWNPLSWVMEAAAIMAIALANGGVSVRFIYFFFFRFLLLFL